MRKPMTTEQFARYQDLEHRINLEAATLSQLHSFLTDAEYSELHTLRTEYALPPQTPAAGTPCTYSIGSDRYPGTVFLVVKGGRTITAEIKGLGLMDFTYRPKDGAYRERALGCGRLSLGVAQEYTDPSF